MYNKVLDILACPRCHAKLRLDDENMRLICDHEALAYPIERDIAVLLPESALSIVNEENV